MGCTRSTHSGGCQVVSCSFVPGEPCRYAADRECNEVSRRFLVLSTVGVLSLTFVVLRTLPFASRYGPLGLHNWIEFWFGGFTIYPALAIGMLEFDRVDGGDYLLCVLAALINSTYFVGAVVCIARSKATPVLTAIILYIVSMIFNVVNLMFVGMLHV